MSSPRALALARACRLCAGDLPLGPRPILQIGTRARVLIVSQAPGRRAHVSGIPFDDRSGDTLRSWLGLDRADFYDPERVAILPIGLCYPGRGRVVICRRTPPARRSGMSACSASCRSCA